MKLQKFVALLMAFAATAAMFTTPAHATLVGRDINGHAIANASAVFLYDTDLNITWLRDANASATAGNTNDPYGLGVGGSMNWASANTWASTLTVGAFSGWRLPTMVDTGTPGCDWSLAGGTDCGYNVQTATSEMAHLWYYELGNKAYCTPGTDCTEQLGWGLTNTGDFQNLQPFTYWSGTEYAPNTLHAWVFHTSYGYQNIVNKPSEMLAMAVRPGDVAAAQVPEPGTLALAAAALAGLGVVRRRRALGASGL